MNVVKSNSVVGSPGVLAQYRWIAMALCALLLAGCASAPGRVSRGAPHEVEVAWVTAFNRGDADAVTALYAPDGQFVNSGTPPVRGTAAIHDAIVEMIKTGTKVRVDLQQNVGAGDTAYLYGTYHVLQGSIAGPETELGTYIEVWRRSAGAWHIDLDVNSTEMTAGTPAPGGVAK